MNTSIFLAKTLGIYFIFISVAYILFEQRLKALILDMMNNQPLMIISGVIALILGILIIVAHNVWVVDWRIIITITGWLALLKGATIILFPELMIKMSMNWVRNKALYYVTFICTFVIGLVLLYCGFIKG